MKTSLLFSEIYEKLWKKTVRINDILPVGKQEALAIEKNLDDDVYPNVIRIGRVFSCDKLFQDFITSRPYLESTEKSVFEYRDSLFVDATAKEVLHMINELGFTKDAYQAYALRWPGSTKLLPVIKDYTRMCLDEIGQHFRQLYTVAKPGWCSKPHVDNKNIEWHGFKIHLPINIDGYIGYVCHDGIQIYKLSKGFPYFCNTSVPHFGINPLKKERMTLIFQIASDKDILSGVEIQSEKDSKLFQYIPWQKEMNEDYDKNYWNLVKKD